MVKKKNNLSTSEKWTYGLLSFFGLTSLMASFVLSYDKFVLLENPDKVLNCTINVWLNCATVMNTAQSNLLGFPNSFIGMMAYPVVITIGVASLMGAKFPKKFWFFAQLGFLAGIIFAYWSFFESLYAIQVLCPYCLTVTFSMTMLWAVLLRYNVLNNNLFLPENWQAKISSWFKKDYDKYVTIGWVTLMIALVILQFGQRM